MKLKHNQIKYWEFVCLGQKTYRIEAETLLEAVTLLAENFPDENVDTVNGYLFYQYYSKEPATTAPSSPPAPPPRT